MNIVAKARVYGRYMEVGNGCEKKTTESWGTSPCMNQCLPHKPYLKQMIGANTKGTINPIQESLQGARDNWIGIMIFHINLRGPKTHLYRWVNV